MKLGIVGLPNVGKSTLFNALTKAGAPSENYPFCTIDPNIGTVQVPDDRLPVLQKIYNAKKIVPAFIDFVDIAGLVRGASKGEGLGNKFLSHIREVDAILHIVRCFENQDIIHVDGSIDPKRDIETINTELVLADLETVQKRLEKTERETKASSDKKIKQMLDFLNGLLNHLSDGNPARTYFKDEEGSADLKELFLLTAKPVIYVANISEDEISKNHSNNKYINEINEIAQKEGSEVIIVSADVEQQIAELPDNEKGEFLDALGLNESGLLRLIKASYKLLGLISFLTAGEPEVRAWTIKKGTKAPQAAGKIHSDIERGFIKAEVISYDELLKYGSITAAKEAGKVRMEGKEYIMHENDIVLFKFNV